MPKLLKANGAAVDLTLLPLAEWIEGGRDAAVGVILEPHDGADALGEDVAKLRLIALRFPSFADGRGFSIARLLRERHGFQGELRAIGHILPDQAAFLRDSGFDAIEIPDDADPHQWAWSENVIRHRYQTPGRVTKPSILEGRRRARAVTQRLDDWRRRYDNADAETLIAGFLTTELAGRLAVVSSFGAESAALLALVAQVDRSTPILFIDTGRHFKDTLAYRDTLLDRLGLTDVRTLRPDPKTERRLDPGKTLYAYDADACCRFRKVEPLDHALVDFDGWISGRKRAHGGQRSALQKIEVEDGKLKLNPLAAWSPRDVRAWIQAHGLPDHPLYARGYVSIGCQPCTTPVRAGEDPRAGRWRTQTKDECGIHMSIDIARMSVN